MRERDSNGDWRRAHIETALQVAERHRQRTEQQLMPTITLHLSEMQQFMEGVRLVARDINETLESYRQLGHEMAHTIRKFQRDAEAAIKVARVVLQPTLDAISREIERRNAIHATAVVVTPDKEVKSETTAIVVPQEKPEGWVPYQLKGSKELCPSVAIHYGRRIIQFRHENGWVCRNIQPLQMRIVNFLWDEATNGDTRGYTVKELGLELTDSKGNSRCSSSICCRISEINELAMPFIYLRLIVSDNGRRRFNELLRQM